MGCAEGSVLNEFSWVLRDGVVGAAGVVVDRNRHNEWRRTGRSQRLSGGWLCFKMGSTELEIFVI